MNPGNAGAPGWFVDQGFGDIHESPNHRFRGHCGGCQQAGRTMAGMGATNRLKGLDSAIHEIMPRTTVDMNIDEARRHKTRPGASARGASLTRLEDIHLGNDTAFK